MALQRKNTSVQEALSAVNLLKQYLNRQRTYAFFDKFYNATAALADDLEIGKPTLPWYRRTPWQLDDGEQAWQAYIALVSTDSTVTV